MYFSKSGRFFKSSEKFGRTEQGAGELGPLGSACRVKVFSLKEHNPKTKKKTVGLEILPHFFLARFQSAVVAQVFS